MNIQKFTMEKMSEIDFQISYAEIDAESPFNTNETHIHKECEIYVNLSGDVFFEVENHIYPVSRGSVIITRPYEYHHCVYRTNELHAHYWITFAAKEQEDFLRIFFKREKGRDNLILLNDSELEEMCQILEELRKRENDGLSRRICFLKMIRLLGGAKRESAVGRMDGTPEVVVKVLQYMDEHLAEDMDIQRLAGVVNVSVSALEHYFKDALGITPFAMLRKKRLIYSMKFLRNGAPVSEAAIQSGFADYSNYIQLFRKQFGMTPLQYKKKFEANL